MMREDPRIRDDPVLRFERGREIRFYYCGRAISAYEVETIAAALYASGIRAFSRSIKY
ncbi:MAG: 2Fe-2S iron-sulfur cluster-binding protein, partial [Candidatus Hydrothermarchaeota archaeon]